MSKPPNSNNHPELVTKMYEYYQKKCRMGPSKALQKFCSPMYGCSIMAERNVSSREECARPRVTPVSNILAYICPDFFRVDENVFLAGDPGGNAKLSLKICEA